MHDLPHHYRVSADGRPEGDVELRGASLDSIASAPPAEFGGPGDRWSPETLLAASVADCFILSFRAIARASRFDWTSLQCDVEGVLDRVDGKTRFVRFDLRATLAIGPDGNDERARRLLEKAKTSCLVTNSLNSDTSLEAVVRRAS